MRFGYHPDAGQTMALDLRLIRYAHSVAAHRSFNRAAATLGIAQPTLSRSIKQLEQQLGLPLFTRSAQGVKPTDFGLMFLKEANSVVAQVADLEQQVSLAKGLKTGNVAVGLGPYAAEALAPGCIRRYVGAHPTIGVRVRRCDRSSRSRAARSNCRSRGGRSQPARR